MLITSVLTLLPVPARVFTRVLALAFTRALVLAFTLVFILGFAPGQACAQEPARAVGTIEGRVLTIDRMHGAMTVQTARQRYAITILPSTTIAQRGGEFHTIADLRRGQTVRVYLSKRGDEYVAEIIRLRDER